MGSREPGLGRQHGRPMHLNVPQEWPAAARRVELAGPIYPGPIPRGRDSRCGSELPVETSQGGCPRQMPSPNSTSSPSQLRCLLVCGGEAASVRHPGQSGARPLRKGRGLFVCNHPHGDLRSVAECEPRASGMGARDNQDVVYIHGSNEAGLGGSGPTHQEDLGPARPAIVRLLGSKPAAAAIFNVAAHRAPVGRAVAGSPGTRRYAVLTFGL
jgi:hypothetical protein